MRTIILRIRCWLESICFKHGEPINGGAGPWGDAFCSSCQDEESARTAKRRSKLMNDCKK